MKTAFLFAVTAFLMVSPSASQASPANALNCPSEQPNSFSTECSDDSITGCNYSPFSCPGSDEVIYIDSCSCDIGELLFICFSASMICEPELPTEATNSQASPANALNCPREEPTSFSTECSDDSITGCEYNPFSCPGSDEVTYIDSCSCDTGELLFICASKLIICEPELPTEATNSQASPANALSCPSEQPTSFSTECNDDSITGCEYNPFSCPESDEVTYIDSFSCRGDGIFDRVSKLIRCDTQPNPPANPGNALNCPSERPPSNSECADDSINGCEYTPFSCPGSDEVTYVDSCSCDTGGFRCASADVICEPAEEVFTNCFSAESLVDVKGQGSIQMKNLKIGDMVHTGNSKYEQVYSFGHYAPDMLAQFLQVHVKDALTPLSISSDHMVFVKSRGGFVPASDLKEGDQLMDGAGNELFVASIVKKDKVLGVFAPFTPSGKIVVNDILASSFVAMDSKLTIGGVEFSNQWIARTFEFPHRVACHYMGQCPNEVYDEDGISMWVSTPHKIGQWMLTQNSLIRNMFFASLVAVLSVFAVVEALFVYPASLVIVVAAAHFYYYHRGQNKAPA